jgi:dihydroorotate dehydrogenase (fumarate)
MLSTNFLNQDLPTCIYNASGPKCTSLPELITLARSPHTAATLTKSTTLLQREGNPHPRYWESSDSSLTINSTGLANLGYQAYGEFAHTIKQINAKKPYIISVAGLSSSDNLQILEYYNHLEHEIDAIELNLSCPNLV